MDPQGLALSLSPSQFLEILRLWDAQASALERDWAVEQQSLEVYSLAPGRSPAG